MGPAPAPTVQRLGRYEVIRHLASGGMAEIYLARNGAETVVVKVISPERGGDKKFIQMFLDEARVAATLHHPNIAGMLEVGRQDDVYFLAMEFVDGDTVRALLERAVTTGFRIPLPVCLHIVMGVAAGLHHAHERKGATGEVLQIVHRDVTPSNIMLGWDGAVKLLDFGIARANNRAAETQSGTIKGKFAYMSPEQCKGKPVDRRTDVFALGIVLYELTTQRRAFRTENDFETMDRIVKGKIALPSTIVADYPPELETIVLKALANEVEDRYQSAEALRAALEGYARHHRQTATAADVTATMNNAFRGGFDPLGQTIEETNSDVEVSIGAFAGQEVPTARTPLGAGPGDSDDAAETQRRMPPAAADLEPASTGPMPVMPPSRPSTPFAVVAQPASTARHLTGPNAILGGRAVTDPRIPTDEWNRPQRTILGTGPLPVARPVSNPGLVVPPAIDESARHVKVELPAAADFVALGEPTQVRRAHRRGLTLAIVAIVVVVAVTTAIIVLGGRGASTAVAPAATPTAP